MKLQKWLSAPSLEGVEQTVNCLTIEIDSNLADVSLAAVAVHAICLHAGLDQSHASLVELSIVEAVTNSIKHAYLGEPGHKVVVDISVSEEALRFDLYDTGRSMSSEQEKKLVQGRGIAEQEYADRTIIPENGRGIEIIHRTMDRVEYNRESDCNHLILEARPFAFKKESDQI